MIANDEQLEIVREQVKRLETALESLAQSVGPKNESQYRVLAEGYVDQLEILRADIDDYLRSPTDEMPATGVPARTPAPHVPS
jgi:hypothetical protein